MPISFSTLDTSLDALRLTTEKKTFIIAEIQRVLIDHIMSHRLDPSGLFQMEICLDHDVRRTSDPKMQTHLIIDFGNKPIHPGLLEVWKTYYGTVILLQMVVQNRLSFLISQAQILS